MNLYLVVLAHCDGETKPLTVQAKTPTAAIKKAIREVVRTSGKEGWRCQEYFKLIWQS